MMSDSIGIQDNLPFVADLVKVLKEVTIHEIKLIALLPKSFVEVKLRIPGIKEIAERVL